MDHRARSAGAKQGASEGAHTDDGEGGGGDHSSDGGGVKGTGAVGMVEADTSAAGGGRSGEGSRGNTSAGADQRADCEPPSDRAQRYEPKKNHPRMARERRTLRVMVALYCRHHHSSRGGRGAPCDECGELQAYALEKLGACPFQEAKTTCANCPVHCYRPEMRARVRVVMRYAGPRMLWRHPLLALRHLRDGRRKRPGKRQR